LHPDNSDKTPISISPFANSPSRPQEGKELTPASKQTCLFLKQLTIPTSSKYSVSLISLKLSAKLLVLTYKIISFSLKQILKLSISDSAVIENPVYFVIAYVIIKNPATRTIAIPKVSNILCFVSITNQEILHI